MTDETTRGPGAAGGATPTGTDPSGHASADYAGDQPGPTGAQPTGADEGLGPASGSGPESGRPPLRRSVDDRKVAGVCGGLGRHLDVDPVIFRVLFAVFAIFGGAGVLLYGIGWLLLPADGEEQSDGQRLLSGQGDGSALLAVAVVVLGFAVFLGFLSGGWDGTFLLIIAASVIFAVVWSSNRNRGQSGWQPPSDWGQPSPQGPQWWRQPAPPGQPAGGGSATMTGGPTGTAAAAADPTTGPASGPTAGPATDPAADGYPGTMTATAGGGPSAPGPHPYLSPFAPPPEPKRSSPLPWIVISVALIVTGALVALGMSGMESITAQVVLASVLIVVGAGLVIGTWFGRARSLIGIGSIVVVALVTVATYSIPVRGGVGDRNWAPQTVAEVRSPYRLAAGDARLDVTQLDPKGGTVQVEASVVFGVLRVLTDDDVRLVVRAHSGMGAVSLPNGSSDGVPADRSYTVDAVTGDSKGTLELTLDVGMGEVEVERVAA